MVCPAHFGGAWGRSPTCRLAESPTPAGPEGPAANRSRRSNASLGFDPREYPRNLARPLSCSSVAPPLHPRYTSVTPPLHPPKRPRNIKNRYARYGSMRGRPTSSSSLAGSPLAQLNPQVGQIRRLSLQKTTICLAQPFLLQPVIHQVRFNVIKYLRSKLDDPMGFDQKLLQLRIHGHQKQPG